MTSHRHSAGDRRRLFSLALGLLAAGCAALPLAVAAAEPLALKKIMQDLGKDLQLAVDGISREDYPLIEKSALAIANHPEPPFTEKARIIAFVGTDIVKFKSHDSVAHDAALAMAKAAREKDGLGAIAAFQRVQNGCFGCHAAYRKRFVEHFYGAAGTVPRQSQ